MPHSRLPDYAFKKRMLDFAQLKEFLRLPEDYLTTLVFHTKGELRIPSHKIGKERRFQFEEILLWLEKRKT